MSDRLTVNWSVRHCLVWAGGKTRMKTVTLDTGGDQDIAVIMQNRAKTGIMLKETYSIFNNEFKFIMLTKIYI